MSKNVGISEPQKVVHVVTRMTHLIVCSHE